MARYKARLGELPSHITFKQGDVSDLPFPNNTFDMVLSMNGLHCFPDKTAAIREMMRVLKPGGIFLGCTYIQGENIRSDFFVRIIYVSQGFFVPPFHTRGQLYDALRSFGAVEQLQSIHSFALFRCRKI